jgi:hypothetical protein
MSETIKMYKVQCSTCKKIITIPSVPTMIPIIPYVCGDCQVMDKNRYSTTRVIRQKIDNVSGDYKRILTGYKEEAWVFKSMMKERSG